MASLTFGTTDVDYQTSIAQRTAAAPTGTPGAFRNGATTGVGYSDFDQSYNPINSYEQGSGAGGYVVRKGDTLQGFAAGLYGDASLWYKIAEVNGLSGQTALIEGQSLTLIVTTEFSDRCHRPGQRWARQCIIFWCHALGALCPG